MAAQFGPDRPRQSQDHPGWLALAALVVIILPKLPFGNYLLYPFTILTTWFHEMGHGLTAMALGMDFDRLVIFANGSGYALTQSAAGTFSLTHAVVSAGGPLGPAAIGSLLILSSRNQRMRRIALALLAAAIILSTVIWVRSLIGWAVLVPMGLGILALALKANEGIGRFAVQFLGIHAAISMFGQWDYLFSQGAVLDGMTQVSDTGAIAAKLPLPYWFWAAVIVVIAAAMIGASLYTVLRQNDPQRVIR